MNITTGYQDSPEKAHVRTECWLPQLASRKQARAGRIRYLTLPARDLAEVRLLAGQRILEGMGDLVVCEVDLLDYYTICKMLPSIEFHSPAEVPTIAHGRIEDLITNGSLDQLFPFDAANLDFVGGAWGNDRSQASRKLQAIRCLVQKQAVSRHAFTLFLTVSTRGGGQRVLEEVIDEQREVFESDAWSTVSSQPHHAKVLLAVPIILAHWAIDEGFGIRCTHRYTYIGSGLDTRMLKFAFEFDPFDAPAFTSVTTHKQRMERQMVREMLEQPIIEVYYSESDEQVTEREYDPVVRW